MSDVKVNYRDHDITYSEWSNKWTVAETSIEALSLRQAKESVDARVKRLEKEPFESFECFLFCYRRLHRGRVTSQDGDTCWVSYTENGEKKRHKSALRNVCRLTPETEAIVKQLESYESAVEAAKKTYQVKFNQLVFRR